MINSLIIKSEKIQSLKERYGEEIFNECISLSSKGHPRETYEKINKKKKKLRECFCELFSDLIKS
jgi:hypothetical protein